MVTKGKIKSGLKFNVFYRGSKLVVDQVSTEWEAKRRAVVIFAARTGNRVCTWELSCTRLR
tara:strand:+ start:311 stop:493 length:183 start_codon:yes stop_codon:yes gene_type:complete